MLVRLQFWRPQTWIILSSRPGSCRRWSREIHRWPYQYSICLPATYSVTKSMCKWCSALHDPMVWPMLHIGCLIGLGSSSESSRLRTILWYICQQSDGRWVDTKGKTSSRLDGACSVCFKRKKNLWAQFSMWKQISERCVVLLCWGQTSVAVLWTLMLGHKSLFSLALWSCSIKIPPPQCTPGHPALWCKRLATSGQMEHMTPDGRQMAWEHQSQVSSWKLNF